MNEKQLAGEKAAEYVQEGMIVGLGTGSTVYYTIMKLGERVKNGLKIKGVSTSSSTTKLASELGIPMTTLNEADRIDLTIDGADEVDKEGNGIKGGGGALLFEKMVAAASDSIIWVVGVNKLVEKLGAFPLPVEVIPFGYKQIQKKLSARGIKSDLRQQDGEVYKTDSGNYILDLQMGTIENPAELDQWLNGLAGVVENGLFNGMVNKVIAGKDGGTEVIEYR
ncbi:ribose-5-phosphate isomerase RpiA [Bacillus marinisedimentorum]|uniref:ribose-5-phosphate isomerase RpiA n=1 Tax=Bacillus marinisedimentorum TaxID=1821260 RepID=UPI0007DFC13A|nr:ribose-5-phosphate isomerase RpiA [Bacillus marinisedimentorum]